MPRQLWLLRHGDAESHGSVPDEERPLTERGELQARNAGGAMARLKVEFEAVRTSPRVRALETARLALEAMGTGEPEVHWALSGGFGADDAIELLESIEPDGRMLIVGHEPDFSRIVAELCGARIDMRKGGIAVVRVGPAGGELVALLRPREIALLAS